MSDQNPPEQPSFNRPAGGDPTTPIPSSSGVPQGVPQGSPPPSSPPPSPAPGAGSTPPPPPPPVAPVGAPSGGPSGMSSIPDPAKESAGFFTALFDFSFTNFVTPILVRFVYLLATVALVATWLIFVFAGFANSAGAGFAALILGPIFVIIYLAVIRMTLEFYLSVVRMSEDIHKRLPQA